MKKQSILILAFTVLASSSFADFAKFNGSVYNTGDKQWTGIEQLQQASDGGDALAQYTYAWALDEGKGVMENESTANRLFVKSIAGLKALAKAGNADAMTALGDIYDDGEGVSEDKKEAAAWYAKAVEKGHAYAMYCLADLYKDGEGVAKSLEKAKELYSAAAKKGVAEAESELREIERGDID